MNTLTTSHNSDSIRDPNLEYSFLLFKQIHERAVDFTVLFHRVLRPDLDLDHLTIIPAFSFV